MAHSFGGPWTEVKLDAVQYYLECYAKALTAAGMDIWYLDAFAGSGDREVTSEIGGILEGRPLEEVKETLDGSARRALKVQPPFKHFIFIEMDKVRSQALEALRTEELDRDIRVFRGDANAELRRFASQPAWSQRNRSYNRAVVFLDPYALHVDWETLMALAATRRIDVWYLFPLRDVVRQLARRYDRVGVKEPMLDRVLGRNWRDLYEAEPERQPSFLGDDLFDTPTVRRKGEVADIENWFGQRLRDIFSYVPEPLPILTAQGRKTFSLFLCVGNPAPQAVNLAKQFVKYLNQRHARR
jgi:three-Cys-motif partner protein